MRGSSALSVASLTDMVCWCVCVCVCMDVAARMPGAGPGCTTPPAAARRMLGSYSCSMFASVASACVPPFFLLFVHAPA